MELIETIKVYTLLGIRFWDQVTNTQIRDNLIVTARCKSSSELVVTAFRTASGLYAFQGLPGLREFENRSHESQFLNSPPDTGTFIIEVKEEVRVQNYLPITCSIDLPLPDGGIFPFHLYMSPPRSIASCFYLFSAPTRPVSPGLGVVRGYLVDYRTRQPASHAVVEVQIEGHEKWYGLTDEGGRLAVLFPYPLVDFTRTTSPSESIETAPLEEQKWTVTISVRYEPDKLDYDVGMELPDLSSIFKQSYALIYPVDSESPQNQGDVPHAQLLEELKYGQELILKTENREGRTELLIQAQETALTP